MSILKGFHSTSVAVYLQVQSQIPCDEQYVKLETLDKVEVVKVTPQDTQKDGPIVTTSAVYASHSEDEDGYLGDRESSKGGDSDDRTSNLGDRESSKDGDSDDGTSNLGDRESSEGGDSDDRASNLGDGESSKDGDSDYGTSNLGERDPADGEEHPTPPKYATSLNQNKNLDPECNKVPQIQRRSPKVKELPASEQYNMLDYLNLQDQTDLYNSGVLQLLISKQSPRKDLQKLGQLSGTPPYLSSPLPQSPLILAQQGKKRKSQKKKKRRQRERIISCGNSLSKAHSLGVAPQSQEQSHANNKGSDSVCTGQVTKRKRCSRHQDGRSSSSSSGGKKSSGESKSETNSSSTSSNSSQPKKKRKTKKHPQDKEHKSSSEFETSEDVSSNAVNMKEGPSMAFVPGSELEASSKPEGKASDRESLSLFTSPKAKKSIKKREIGRSNGLSKAVPPAATTDHQPEDINELLPTAIDGLPPTGIGDHHPGCLPPTGIGDHHPGCLPQVCSPFILQAEEACHSNTIVVVSYKLVHFQITCSS